MNLPAVPTDYSALPLALTPADIAQVMGMSKTNTYQLMNSADFPSFRVGRKLYISRTAFVAWLESGGGQYGY